MEIANNTVVSLRYVMKDAKGEIVEDNTGGKPIEYLHGSGSILPALEQSLHGLIAGQTTAITLSDKNLQGTFHFDVIIDKVRTAAAQEIKLGKPVSMAETNQCGPGCDC
jgi:FKBP-type peptidyl-prolyl cis-trans isomerase SlyD